MSHDSAKDDPEKTDKAVVTLPGTVEKIIPPIFPNDPEKAQISVEGAEELCREIHVENTLVDEDGNEVGLKKAPRLKSPSLRTPTPRLPRNSTRVSARNDSAACCGITPGVSFAASAHSKRSRCCANLRAPISV